MKKKHILGPIVDVKSEAKKERFEQLSELDRIDSFPDEYSSAFHADGPAKEKARSTNFVLSRGT